MKEIFRSDGYAVEWHTQDDRRDRLVYTFTPFNFTDLTLPGFGVTYLMKRGFDILAVKCADNSWYQGLDKGVLDEIARIGRGYKHVAAYGTSMGGFAVIAFSGILRPSIVLAVSPQYAIDEDFDQRWRVFADRVWRYRISHDTLGGARFVVIYDPTCEPDLEQARRLRAVIPRERFEDVALPFSGHSSARYLLETGQLQSTVASYLRDDTEVTFDTRWSTQRRSRTFFVALGTYAEKRGRLGLAERCFRRAIGLVATDAETHHLMACLLVKRDRLHEALDYVQQAVRLAPNVAAYVRLMNDIKCRIEAERQTGTS